MDERNYTIKDNKTEGLEPGDTIIFWENNRYQIIPHFKHINKE